MTRCNKKIDQTRLQHDPENCKLDFGKDDAPLQNLDRDLISTSSDCGSAGLSTAHDALQ
jgi:hypothetical protein